MSRCSTDGCTHTYADERAPPTARPWRRPPASARLNTAVASEAATNTQAAPVTLRGKQRQDSRTEQRVGSRRTNVVLPAPNPAEMNDLRRAGAPPLRVLVGLAGSFLSVHVVRRLSSSHRGWRAPANNPVSPGRRPGPASHRAARTDEQRSLRPRGCARTTSGSGPAHHFSASAAASLWC